MFNNAIDHSEGAQVHVEVRRTAADIEMIIAMMASASFRRIRKLLVCSMSGRHPRAVEGEVDDRSGRHTGEGIFFSSRMFDTFDILSGGISFSQLTVKSTTGFVTTRSTKTALRVDAPSKPDEPYYEKVFDEYVSGEDYDFSRISCRLSSHSTSAIP